jgi:diguanylate cyclase (GGDEF)-like protein
VSIYKTRDKLTGYGIDDATLETLAEIYPFLISVIDDVLDKFYGDLMGNERTARILEKEDVRGRARMAQKKHWVNYVFSGNYHHKYFEAAERIGKAHWHHGVSLTDFSSAYHRVLGYLTQYLVSKYIDNPAMLLNAMMAIQKVTFMDLECASKAYRIYDQEKQRQSFQVDPLTETGNRAAFLEDMEKHLQSDDAENPPLCIAVIDLDHFKPVNDTHGHVVGDRVLRAMADELKLSLRETDRVYRYGGDEFIAVLPGTILDEAVKIMERALERIMGRTVSTRESVINISASIGVAEYGTDTESVNKFIEKADRALYRAKKTGRSRVAV